MVAVVGLDQVHQQPGGRRLAAAGFADDAQGLALEDVEIDAVHRVHGLVLPMKRSTGKCLTRFLTAGAWRRGSPRSPAHQVLMSMAERRLSDRRLKEIEVMKIISPGSAATQGWT
jgi:hypothetical protein